MRERNVGALAVACGTLLAACEPQPAGSPGPTEPGTSSPTGPPTASPTVSTPTAPTGRACAPFDPDFEAALQAGLEAEWAAQGVPGAALAVAAPSANRCWAGTVGVADLDGSVPWLVDTPYPIGSVTKTFTAALVMQLVEEGALSLDDALEARVATPWGGQGITLRHLMQHTSGIVSYNYVGGFDGSAHYTPQELVDWAAAYGPSLLFSPGSRWDYSNTNYVLLGLTIEAATGRSYETELNERLLGPLGLDDLWLATDNPPDLVRGYDGDPLVDQTDAGQPTVGWAAGGIVGTPAGLAAWGAALFGGRAVSPESFAVMTTPLAVDGLDGAPVEYGMGLFGNNSDEYGPYWGHTGGIGGHLTYLFSLERQDAVVVAMVNSFVSDLDALANAAWIPVFYGP